MYIGSSLQLLDSHTSCTILQNNTTADSTTMAVQSAVSPSHPTPPPPLCFCDTVFEERQLANVLRSDGLVPSHHLTNVCSQSLLDTWVDGDLVQGKQECVGSLEGEGRQQRR